MWFSPNTWFIVACALILIVLFVVRSWSYSKWIHRDLASGIVQSCEIMKGVVNQYSELQRKKIIAAKQSLQSLTETIEKSNGDSKAILKTLDTFQSSLTQLTNLTIKEK